MQKWIKNKIWLPITAVILIWVMIGIGTYGAGVFSKSLGASINIVGNGDFSFYSDQAATHLITQVSLPDASPGNTSTFTVYAKNTSLVTETLSTGSIAIPSSVGTLTLTFDGQPQANLTANAVSKVVGTMNVASSAAVGPVTFTFNVNASPVVSTSPSPTATATGTLVSYSSTIQPIWNQYCISCHGTSPGGTFTSYATTMASRYNNTLVVIPGNAAGSILYQSVNGTNGLSKMGSLSTSQTQSLASWINQGALNN